MKVFIYNHGFASGPGGSKAQYFKQKLQGLGYQVLIPDLNCGNFEALSITGQIEEVKRTLEPWAGNEIIAIGSSMGALVTWHYAGIYGGLSKILLLAPAFDLLNEKSPLFPPQIMQIWKEKGFLTVPHFAYNKPVKIGYQLVEDALKYQSKDVQINIPTLIIHGKKDEIIPCTLSFEYVRNRPNIQLEIIDSDHQMLENVDLIWEISYKFLFEV